METNDNTVCRLCLSNGDTNSMIPLTNKSENSLTCYGLSLVSLSLVKISVLDNLPQFMCKMCLVQLKQVIEFKIKCENSDLTLQKLKATLQRCSNKNRLQEEIIQHAMLVHSEMNQSQENFCNLDLSNNYQIVKKFSNSPQSESDLNDLNLPINDVENLRFSKDMLYTDTNEKILQNEIKLLSRIEKLVCSKSPSYEKSKICIEQPSIHESKRRQTEVKFLNSMEKLFQKYPQQFSAKLTRNLTCKDCKKTLSTLTEYNRHRKTHLEYKFICEHCGKGFKFQAELNLHTVSVHKTGDFIQCNKCPFRAAKKFLLIEHERIHTGERPFSCEKCGLTFRRRAILRNHEKYHGQKTVQCLHCSKKFFTKWHMLTHVNNSHERSYLYLCPVCGIKYAKNSSVRKHLLEKHGVPKHLQGRINRMQIN